MTPLALKSAQGLELTLIRGFDNQLWAREYHSDGSFTDHDIWHSDITVTVTDPDAWIYKTDTGTALDHCPETLGISK